MAQVEQRSADEGLAGISQEEKPAQGEKVTAAGAEVEASKAGAGTKPFGADIFEDEKPRSSEAAVTPKAVKEPAPEKVKKVEPVVAGVGKPEKAEGKPKSPKLQVSGSKPPAKRVAGSLPMVHDKGKYTVQIASFPDELKAIKMANDFRAKGYPAFTRRAKIKGRGTWYRVRIGTFETRVDAKRYSEALKSNEPRVKATLITRNN